MTVAFGLRFATRGAACGAALVAALAVSGCDPGHATRSSSSAVLAGPGGDSSHVVDPAKVPARLRQLDFNISFRPGPTPRPFKRAIYGVARDKHGLSVNFGVFLVAGTNADAYFTQALSKLVPAATDIGSTSGQSYIVITSAGAHGPQSSKQTQDELGIAGEIEMAVGGLARKAFEEGGP